MRVLHYFLLFLSWPFQGLVPHLTWNLQSYRRHLAMRKLLNSCSVLGAFVYSCDANTSSQLPSNDQRSQIVKGTSQHASLSLLRKNSLPREVTRSTKSPKRENRKILSRARETDMVKPRNLPALAKKKESKPVLRALFPRFYTHSGQQPRLCVHYTHML